MDYSVSLGAARNLRSRRTILSGGIGLIAGWALSSHSSHAAQAPPLATPQPLGPTIPPEITDYAHDWPAPGQNLAAHRAAIDSSISIATVDQLQVAWRFPLTANGPYGAVAAVPLVVEETIYLQDTESNVFALDRETGQVRWQHEYAELTAGPNGVAAGYGLVVGSTGLKADVFALDATTGDEVWRTPLSSNPGEFVLMRPVIYDNVVYAATSPGAYVPGTRGILFALDVQTGAVLWLWDTTVDILWGAAHLNSGGGVWYPPSIDADGNIYFGTGNPAPWPEIGRQAEETTRPGPNLYTSSMVSLDPIAGSLRWYVQATPHDKIDHDFQLTPVLATVEFDGEPVPLAIGSGKTGTVIAANAESGAVFWEVSVGEHNAYGDGASLPEPSATPVAILPGPFGGVLSPLAYAEGILFVPVINAAYTYSDTTDRFDLEQATGEMVALNASDGSVRWRAEVETFFAGGATVANDLVFGAGLDGFVRALDTGTGHEVWRFRAGAGINAPLAIAGDLLLVPAGGPFFSGRVPPPPAQNELIALRLGAGTATPIA